MKILPLVALLIFTVPALGQENELPTSDEAVNARKTYLERVQAAQERLEREIERAKKIYERSLEIALKRAKHENDQDEIARIEAEIAAIKEAPLVADNEEPEAKNEINDKQGEPITSIKQIFGEIPSDLYDNNFLTSKSEADFKLQLKKIFEGREVKITDVAEQVIVQPPRSADEKYMHLTVDSPLHYMGKVHGKKIYARINSILKVSQDSHLLETKTTSKYMHTSPVWKVSVHFVPYIKQRDENSESVSRINIAILLSNYHEH